MSSKRDSGAIGPVCIRCRNQKRKCDRASPKCALCIRLHRTCIYETTPPSSLASPASPGQGPQVLKEPLTLSDLKTAIIQKLSGTIPENIATTYYSTVHTWFPVISDSNLCRRLPRSWDDASAEFCLLMLSMVLLGSLPESIQGQNMNPDLRALYLSIKSYISVMEGIGSNFLDLVQSRLLVVLFEISHGLYPMAYISIGTLVRAADVLVVYEEQEMLIREFQTEKEYKEECLQIWRGILIVDRYITLEDSNWLSATRGRSFPKLLLSDNSMPLEEASPTPHAFSRLFEASNLLEKIQVAVFESPSHKFLNVQEACVTLDGLIPFQNTLEQETPKALKLYSSSWVLFNTGLLLLCESGTKADPTCAAKPPGLSQLQSYLNELLTDIVELIRPSVEGETLIDFNILSPFITLLIYKAAAIVTERIRTGDSSKLCIQTLRALRNMLKLMGKRWLAGSHYLKLLDEDTTPRMAKAIE